MSDQPRTTVLIAGVRNGDRQAVDALFARVYDQLRVIAHARLKRRGGGETLNTTALVHEAYIKLTSGETLTLEDRLHFFALSARAMRFVLIGYARERNAQKRGGGVIPVTLNEELVASNDRAEIEATNLLSIDDALNQLTQVSPRLAEVVELRFFGGLTYE